MNSISPANPLQPNPLQPNPLQGGPMSGIVDTRAPLVTSTGRPPFNDDNFFKAALRERWWLLGIFAILSGAIAIPVSTYFYEEKVTVTTTLMFQPLPNASADGGYTPPTLYTYAELFTSPALMQKIRDDYDLVVPPEILKERLFVVNVQPRGTLLDITFTWNELQKTVDVLNDATQNFIDDVKMRRVESLRKLISHTEVLDLDAVSAFERIQQEVAEAERQAQPKEEPNEGEDSERLELMRALAAVEDSLIQKEARSNATRAQFNSLKKQRSVAFARVRQLTLSRARAEIEKSTNHLSDGSDRHQEFDQMMAELERLASTPLTPDVLVWHAMAREVGGEELAASVWTSPELVAAIREVERLQPRIDELEVEAELSRSEVSLLKRRQETYREKLKSFPTVDALVGTGLELDVGILERLRGKLEVARSRRLSLAARLAGLRELEECGLSEFTVVTPASAELAEVGSNRKKMIALSFVAGMVALGSPVFLISWLRSRPSPVERLGAAFGLSVFSHDDAPVRKPSGKDCWESDAGLRKLAFRIQQTAAQIGAIVLFVGSDQDVTKRLLGPLCGCLSRRETSVLIVDAARLLSGADAAQLLAAEPRADGIDVLRVAEGDHGLMQYLEGGCDCLEDLLTPTVYEGVDFVAHGCEPFPLEAMASTRIKNLMSDARKRYDVILVVGPSLENAVDVQFLAAEADAIVLAFHRKASVTREIRQAIEETVRMDMPHLVVVG